MAEDVEIANVRNNMNADVHCNDDNRWKSTNEDTNLYPTSEDNHRLKTNNASEDKRYEEIRNETGNERHILFHFFTLFSISFICGIVLIHLSLWMNSYFHALMSHGRPFDGIVNDILPEYEVYVKPELHEASEVVYSPIYTEDDTIRQVFLSPFYYTGTYFSPVTRNVTYHTHDRYSKSYNFSSVK